MVEESTSNYKNDKSSNIVSVYNLPPIYDESDVHSLFANVGTVVECSIKHDELKSQTVAIVKFSSEKEVEDAVVLSGVSVRYHILKITKGEPQVIAENEENEDSESKDIGNKITKSMEIDDKISRATLLKLPEYESFSQSKSSTPELEKRNENKRTRIKKGDDGGSYYRGRGGVRSDNARDKYRRNRSYTRSRSYSRDRSRRDQKYGLGGKYYRRYSSSSSRSSSYSSRSYYSRGSYRSSSSYSDESDGCYSRGRRVNRRNTRSRTRREHTGRNRSRG